MSSKLNARLELRLTTEQKARFREAAEEDGLDVGAWLRKLAEARIRVRSVHDGPSISIGLMHSETR